MTSAATFIEQLQASQPTLAVPLAELLELYNRKLWHELTLKLEDAVAAPEFQHGDVLVQIYQNFIGPDVESRLNKLKTDRKSASAFLEGVAVKLKADGSPRAELPVLFINMHLALLHLQSGALPAAKALVEAGRESLDAATDVEASVHAAFYFAQAQLCKAQQSYAEFYRAGLLYLAYVSVAQLPEATRQELAVDLSLAALLGDGVYNFGELLGHAVLRSLAGTAFAWLPELLAAFNAGDLPVYDALCVKHAAALNAQPVLVARERQLRQKITVLALMEVVAALPADNRTVSLAAIGERTRLGPDGCELLLMKALSDGLLQGAIDQVKGTVRVTWLQPRVLLLGQVADLRAKVDGWVSKVHSARLALEQEAPDLVGLA